MMETLKAQSKFLDQQDKKAQDAFTKDKAIKNRSVDLQIALANKTAEFAQVLAGESKAAFVMGKVMAGANAFINTSVGATKALALGPPGIPLAGMIKAMGALEIAAIIGTTVQGFKGGGFTGNSNSNDVAGVVHGNEFVLNEAATNRVGIDKLNRINSGGNMGVSGGVHISTGDIIIQGNTTPETIEEIKISQQERVVEITEILREIKWQGVDV
jgi:hypothetical protein